MVMVVSCEVRNDGLMRKVIFELIGFVMVESNATDFTTSVNCMFSLKVSV